MCRPGAGFLLRVNEVLLYCVVLDRRLLVTARPCPHRQERAVGPSAWLTSVLLYWRLPDGGDPKKEDDSLESDY